MTISLIACIDKNNGIGSKGSLLSKPPLDFKHFKELTMNNFCIFGKETFKEIGKPLKGRQNIVLSRNPKIDLPNGVFHYQSAKDVLFEYENYAERSIDIFVCGGEKVYQEFLPQADYIYLTIVDNIFEHGDKYFPKFDLDEWKITESIKHEKDESYPYDYYFVSYERRS